MNRFAAVLVAILLTAAPAGVGAQSPEAVPEDGQPSASERLQEGAAAIVEGLRLLMDQLQSYEPPEIMPNGDIIIRRRPPGESEPPPEEAPKGGDDGDDGPLRL